MITGDTWDRLIDSLTAKTKAGKLKWSRDKEDLTGTSLSVKVDKDEYILTQTLPGIGPIKLSVWDRAGGGLLDSIDSAGPVLGWAGRGYSFTAIDIPGKLADLLQLATSQANKHDKRIDDALRRLEEL